MTAFFLRMPTFSPDFAGDGGFKTGDVICYRGNYDRAYASGYAGFPQPGGDLAKTEIAVENSYFSTFSTGFSTGVFHRAGEGAYALLIYITQL